MNVFSVIIGFVALAIGIVGFIPLLGWLNWFVIPLAVLGLVPGLLSPASSGSTINLVVIVMGVVRLILGGGIL